MLHTLTPPSVASASAKRPRGDWLSGPLFHRDRCGVVAAGRSRLSCRNEELVEIRRPVSAGLETYDDAELCFPTRTEAFVPVFRPAAEPGGADPNDVLLIEESPCPNR